MNVLEIGSLSHCAVFPIQQRQVLEDRGGGGGQTEEEEEAERLLQVGPAFLPVCMYMCDCGLRTVP